MITALKSIPKLVKLWNYHCEICKFYILYFSTHAKLTPFSWYGYQFFVRNTKIYMICKLYRVISVFNYSQNPNSTRYITSLRCYKHMSTTKRDIFLSDVNECAINNGGCDHICHNYLGGHYCSCQFNYRLNEDKKSCEYGMHFICAKYKTLEMIT
jgi:hypothetical protein